MASHVGDAVAEAPTDVGREQVHSTPHDRGGAGLRNIAAKRSIVPGATSPRHHSARACAM